MPNPTVNRTLRSWVYRKSENHAKFIRAVIEFVLLILIAIIFHFWHGTTRYKPGETPSNYMPVVLHVIGSNPPRYELVRPQVLAATLSANPSLSLMLPELTGSFSTHLEYGFPEKVSFQVSKLPNGQRILVKHFTDSYGFEGQYVTNGSSFQPERFFVMDGMSILAAGIFSFIGAKGLSRLQALFWPIVRSARRSRKRQPEL